MPSKSENKKRKNKEKREIIEILIGSLNILWVHVYCMPKEILRWYIWLPQTDMLKHTALITNKLQCASWNVDVVICNIFSFQNLLLNYIRVQNCVCRSQFCQSCKKLFLLKNSFLWIIFSQKAFRILKYNYLGVKHGVWGVIIFQASILNTPFIHLETTSTHSSVAHLFTHWSPADLDSQVNSTMAMC